VVFVVFVVLVVFVFFAVFVVFVVAPRQMAAAQSIVGAKRVAARSRGGRRGQSQPDWAGCRRLLRDAIIGT